MDNANGTSITDAACPDCKCDTLIPLMKIKIITSFTGNKLQMEWPSRENADEIARVACPACQTVFTVKGAGIVQKASNKLFSKGKGKAKVLKFSKK